MTAIYRVMIQVSLHCSDIFSSVGLLSYLISFAYFIQNRIVSKYRPELSPKRRHMYADGSAEAVHGGIPDMLDQFFLTYRSAKVKKQIFQNAVFFSCQGNQGSVGIGLSFDGIEFDPATFQTDILCTNFLLVRLRIRASSSCRWNGFSI